MQLALPVILALTSAILGTAWGKVFFEERFDDGSKWEKRWVVPSEFDKGTLGQFKLSSGKWFADEKINAGLQTNEDARFYAISSRFKQFSNKGKSLVLQLTVKHEQTIDCGGGYVKLLPFNFDQSKFNGDTPYRVMFGPDHCGNKRQVHVIINYDGKNHMIKKLISAPADDLTHIYTLVIRSDQTYSVYVDGEEEAKGSMLDDWSFLPPKTIPDPSAKKPDDWVDIREIDDPEDRKPDDWVEDLPREIPDGKAEKPSNWDDEMDGEWARPMVDNPAWKPKWKPKKIKNPQYKGPWTPPQIPNPEYKPVDNVYQIDDFGGIGIEVWQVKSGTIFDNLLVTDDLEYAEKVAKQLYKDLKEREVSARDAWVEANKPKEDEPAIEKPGGEDSKKGKVEEKEEKAKETDRESTSGKSKGAEEDESDGEL